MNRPATLAPARAAPEKTADAFDLGPFTLTVARGPTGAFAGIGRVLHRGRTLRADTLPWILYTESDAGFSFQPDELVGVERPAPDELVFALRATGRWLARAQEADAMGDARVRARRVSAPTATFTWRFRLAPERVGDLDFDGLAMTAAFHAPGHPAHWLLEDATWELDGAADGCTLIQQDCSAMDFEQAVRADSAFSTIEKFHTDGWGGAYPMDMMPRAAGAAIGDFQAKGDTILALYAPRPSLTRARIDKFADENVIHYADRAFFALAERVAAPERRLLVHRAARPFARHARRNAWLDFFVHVRARVLEPFGFTPEIPMPSTGGMIWDDEMRRWGAGWSRPYIDAMPAWQRLGYRQAFTHGVWESITSDPAPPERGNMCCPYRFRFAGLFGGAGGMRALCRAAKAHGLDVYQWFSFHLSRHAALWKEHPDWVLKEANGDPWDGNYHTLWSGRFRSDFAAWMAREVADVCADAELPGIFWDSYQNLGVTGIDWSAPDKAPQAEDIWRFQAALQKRGIRQRCEVVTVFGVSAVALFGFEEDGFRRRLWADLVRDDAFFALIDTAPAFFSDRSAFTRDRLSPALYFRLAAHRSIPPVEAKPWADDPAERPPGGALAEEYAAVNHVYLAALPNMHRLRLTEGGRYTLWLDDDGAPSVVWAFGDAEAPWTGSATELKSGRRVTADGSLKLAEGDVWRLEPRRD